MSGNINSVTLDFSFFFFNFGSNEKIIQLKGRPLCFRGIYEHEMVSGHDRQTLDGLSREQDG